MRHPKYELRYDRGGCSCQYGGDARRLYIREGPRGKQKFIPWGVVCKYCGFIFPNTDNPIETMKKQIKWIEEVQKHKKKKISKKEAEELITKLRANQV